MCSSKSQKIEIWKNLLECCDASVSSECSSGRRLLVADADLANGAGLLGADAEGRARVVELRLSAFCCVERVKTFF